MTTTIFSILETRSTKPKYPNTTNVNPTHDRNPKNHNTKKQLTNQEKQGKEYEIHSDSKKTHTFS